MIRFDCPNCSKRLNVPDGAAGKRGSCPACKTKLVIPETEETFEEEAEPTRISATTPAPRRAGTPARSPAQAPPRPRDLDEDDENEGSLNHLSGLEGGRAMPERRERFVDDDEDEDEEEEERPKKKKKRKRRKSTIGPMLASVGKAFGVIFGILFVIAGIGGVVMKVGSSAWLMSNSAKGEEIAKQIVAKMDEMTATMKTIQDANSARSAVPRLRTSVNELIELMKKANEIRVLKSDAARLTNQYKPQVDAAGERFVRECDRVKMIPGAAEAFQQLEQDFKRLEQTANSMK